MGIDNWSLSTSSDVDNWDYVDPYLKVALNYVTLTSLMRLREVSHATLAYATELSLE